MTYIHMTTRSQDGTDAVLTGEGKRLSPKDIADIVSQSTNKSANNPFAKGASPFSSKKSLDLKTEVMTPTPSGFYPPSSSSSSNPSIKNEKIFILNDKNENRILREKNSREREYHRQAFLDSAEGDHEKGKNQNNHNNSNNSKNSTYADSSSTYRSRAIYHDTNPSARNPFEGIVDGKNNASSLSELSAPSSPITPRSGLGGGLGLNSLNSPSAISSPIQSSKSKKDIYDSDNYDDNEKYRRNEKMYQSKVMNDELYALKRRTSLPHLHSLNRYVGDIYMRMYI